MVVVDIASTYTGLTEPIFHPCIGMIVAVFALTNLVQLKQVPQIDSITEELLQVSNAKLLSFA